MAGSGRERTAPTTNSADGDKLVDAFDGACNGGYDLFVVHVCPMTTASPTVSE